MSTLIQTACIMCRRAAEHLARGAEAAALCKADAAMEGVRG